MSIRGWAADPKSEIAEGFRLLRLALSIDGMTRGVELNGPRNGFFLYGDFDAAREMVDRAVALNPNSALHGTSEVGLTILRGRPKRRSRALSAPFD